MIKVVHVRSMTRGGGLCGREGGAEEEQTRADLEEVVKEDVKSVVKEK